MQLFSANSFLSSGTESFLHRLEFNFKVLPSGNSWEKDILGKKTPFSKFIGVILMVCSSILSFSVKYTFTFVLSLIILATAKFFNDDFWLSSTCTTGVSTKVW